MCSASGVQPETIATSRPAPIMPAYPSVRLFCHGLFNLVRLPGKRGAQKLRAALRNQYHVFDPHADILFGDINAGLDGNYHAGLERSVDIRIVDLQANLVADAMNEVFPERLAVQIFSMGVHVILGDFSQAIGWS